jgi:uncharacterized protein
MTQIRAAAKPWYQEPWPWLLMAGPAVVVVAGFATLYLAVASEDGLVVDDYYRQGLAINATLAREERARSLGLNATLVLSPHRNGVQVSLEGVSGLPSRLRLRLVHPTRAGQDQSVTLVFGPAATYAAALRPVEPGTWHVVVEDEVAGWRLAGTLLAGQDRMELRPRQEK